MVPTALGRCDASSVEACLSVTEPVKKRKKVVAQGRIRNCFRSAYPTGGESAIESDFQGARREPFVRLWPRGFGNP